MYDRNTFILQSVYETTEYTQEVTVAVGADYQRVGFSATLRQAQGTATEKEEFKLRTKTPVWHVLRERVCHASKQLAFSNTLSPTTLALQEAGAQRAPSIQHKLDSHIRLVNILTSVSSVSEIFYHQEGG